MLNKENDAQMIEKESDQVEEHINWESAVSLSLSAILAIIAWYFGGVDPFRSPQTAAVLFVFTVATLMLIHAGITITLGYSLRHTPVPLDWACRIGYLVSLALLLVRWITLQHYPTPGLKMLWLILVSFGPYLGGMLITLYQQGMVENNFPPSQRIQREVYQRHQDYITADLKLSAAKRGFDLVLAITGLIVSFPLWMLISFVIWIEDPGPVLFVKNSVGKGGVNFHQFKFRTMVYGAESATGPIPAQKSDERVLWTGRFLRKAALDELPQLFNIVRAEMSFVGPRPQRTVLVHDYLHEMPEYAERHRVHPGLSGLAQVAGDYYLTPRQKLRFDRLYIRHASLSFDLKLIFLAVLITFLLRWHRSWDGRLPRKLVRIGTRKK